MLAATNVLQIVAKIVVQSYPRVDFAELDFATLEVRLLNSS